MAGANLICTDERGYEKYLAKISEYRAEGVGIVHAIERGDNDIVYFEIDFDSLMLLQNVAADMKKIVYEIMGIPKDCRAHISQQKIFLAIKWSTKKVVGFVEAHPLSTAYLYIIDENHADDSLPCIGNRPVPVRCGVSAIWVKPAFRKKGVATDLLNLVKRKMFPEELNWLEIAFAHISFSGKRFVCHFFKKCMEKDPGSDLENSPPAVFV